MRESERRNRARERDGCADFEGPDVNGRDVVAAVADEERLPVGRESEACGAGRMGIVLTTVEVFTWTSRTPAELATYRSPTPFAAATPEKLRSRTVASAPPEMIVLPIFTRVPASLRMPM